MLKGIPKIISPEILKILCEMGHGDEIVISDANFPAASIAQRLVRADGIPAADMLEAVLKLIPLDQYDPEHFILMQKVPGDDNADTSAWDDYTKILKKESPESEPTFCERAKKAYAVIITGEERQYANIILKKGCVLPGM